MNRSPTRQYGLRLDCEANGCDPKHRDHGYVYFVDGEPPSPGEHRLGGFGGEHACEKVTRTVTYGEWVPMEDKSR